MAKELTNMNENKTYKRRTILKALAGVPVLGFFAYETIPLFIKFAF